MSRYQFAHRRAPRRRVRFSRVLLVLVILAMLAYPFVEPYLLEVDRHTVTVAGLPSNLKGLKIVFVSDIHQGRFFSQSRVNSLISEINALSPDIVILGGDYAEDSDGAIEFFRNAPPIQARLGVRAVVGNHDRTEPESNYSLLLAEMKNYGALPLNNYVDRLKVGQSYVYIAGVDDYDNGYPDVAGVAASVSADDFVIFVGHNPDLLMAAQTATDRNGDNHWFDLALFGHTHGGQVTLFGHALLRRYLPEVGERYLSGWKEESRAHILVSNGVGTSVLPVRLFARPQIHLITLKSK